MFQSEILKEKDRVQKKLSTESGSIHEYLQRSQFTAREIAVSYGFNLKYAEISSNILQKSLSSDSIEAKQTINN